MESSGQTPTGGGEFTSLLIRSREGEGAALDELLPFVYDELRAVARRRLGGARDAVTIQPTELVNEVYLRLVDQRAAGVSDRAHFVCLCARVMRQVLVDRARERNALKRDGGARLTLGPGFDAAGEEGEAVDLLALDEAIRTLDERRARVVELRYFSGLTVEEVAAELGVSKRTVEADWFFARAWLRRALDGADGAGA